jgi:hypothetical protein
MFKYNIHNFKISHISLTTVRYITIQQPATTITTQPISLETSTNNAITDNISTLPIIDSDKIETIKSPIFKTIGTPASSLSVSIPPSIPVHVKKGSIMSVYSFAQNKQNNFVKSKWEILQPLRGLWFEGKVSSYQSIIGTVPLQLLISAYDGFENLKSSGTKSFVNLTLDGTFDWILFKPNSLQCYTGNSLNIKIKNLPKDLHYGFKGRGFTWLNGRGLASLVGDGSIFKVGLGVGEEIRVEREKLFAVSVRELSELSIKNNFTSEVWNSVDGLFHQKEKNDDEIKKIDQQKTIKLFNNKIIDDILIKLWICSKNVVDVLKSGKFQLMDYILGSGHYVVIRGPRTILIETGSGSDNFVVKANNLLTGGNVDRISELENIVKREEEWKKPEVNIGDNLGVFRISNGKSTYKNLDNFNEEVKRIENLNKKK